MVADVETLRGTAPTVLAVTLAGPARRVLLKLADGPDAAVDVARTAAVMRLARSAGAPVPEVLAADTSRRTVPWPFLLSEHVPGTELRHARPYLDDEALRDVHRQLAAAVLAVQSVRFPSYGELDAGGTPAGVDVLSALRRRAELRIRRAEDRDLFLRVLEPRTALFAGEPGAVLTHDDLHHANVLVRAGGGRWRLATLLDWDKAWAGPAESDVARMELWDDMTGPRFREVYRAAVPPAEGAAERSRVHQLLWCLEYAAPTDRHRRDTARLLRDLGVTAGR